ncbi:MAG: serine/threonine protein kinase, partial [Pseudonocardia sp.]|nr:serine/threonine protein kinase [Pseudonocardia sp.]
MLRELEAAPVPDNQFGPYELRRLLGRGGMGEVHLAYDRSHQREVAVKLLLESLSSDHEYRARFEREARIAAGLREQHIIPIHRFGEIDNRLYIDMRLVEGEDLGKLLARKRMLPPARAVRIIAQVAAALDAAHRAGLVHRDVKPANVLLAETGSSTRDSVYLADFGIARDSAGGTSGGFTLTGVAIGTPDYMAPERFTAGTCDHRADVYALGCMLYELLTGQKPFSADGALALAYRHVNDPPPLPSSLRPEVSAALDAVVATSMSKDPAARYGSAGELASAAEAATAGDARNGAAPRGQDQATRKPPGPWDPVEPGRRWSRWFYDPSPIVGAAATRPWPAATDYVRAVQASAEPLARSGLPGASVVRDRFGMPATSTGQNAVVFEFNNGHGGLALRCFTRSPRDAAARYRALAPVLAASDCDVVAPARWVDVALTIGGESWPAVVMPWVSGLPLNLAVEDLLGSPRDLVRLAE